MPIHHWLSIKTHPFLFNELWVIWITMYEVFFQTLKKKVTLSDNDLAVIKHISPQKNFERSNIFYRKEMYANL